MLQKKKHIFKKACYDVVDILCFLLKTCHNQGSESTVLDQSNPDFSLT